jgi:pimeloyl-ACP methyl ester carboxylesterase
MYYLSTIVLICISIIVLHVRAMGQDRFEEMDYPFKVQKQDLGNGNQIAYMEKGSGEVILAIHGLASYSPAWKENMEGLSQHYRVIAIDLVGYGKSSKGRYNANMSFHVDQLEGFLQKMEIDKIHLLGHSMGAQVATHFCLKNPTKVISLSMIAPAGIETFTSEQKAFFATVTPEAIAATPDQNYRNNLLLNFYAFNEKAEFMYEDRMRIKEDPQFGDYCFVIAQGIQGMLEEPIFDRLGEIKVPSLVIYGAQDALIPNKYLNPQLDTKKIAEIAKTNISGAQVHLVEEAGHFVMYEQPEEVNQLIENFLGSLEGPIKGYR